MEAILRAAEWKADSELLQRKKTLETGHDLRDLLGLVRSLGVLRAAGIQDSLGANVKQITRLWFNNMRFASTRLIDARWRRQGEVHKRRTFKYASTDFHDRCAAVVKTCEALWQT